MLMVRGINVFPSRIEGVLVGILWVDDRFQVVIDRRRHKLVRYISGWSWSKGGFYW